MIREVLTLPQAAELCGVSRWTLRNLVKSGKLRASRTPGGHYRILGRDLETLVRARKLFHVGQLAPGRVLIADDDPKIRRLLGTILDRDGYEVQYASDGFETGKKVIQFAPQVLILDLIMPGMDGFEVCRHIKEDRETAGIRIIAISAYGSEENRERILELGADIFLEKTPDLKNVGRVIESLLCRGPAASNQPAYPNSNWRNEETRLKQC